ncbi:MAG: hypothetical protein U0800_27275, partial [Isosphaeraceae bacterium]
AFTRPPQNEIEIALEQLGGEEANVRLDDETSRLLRDELARYPEAVALARTVADYARGSHKLTIGPTILDTNLSETGGTRSVARLLLADAGIRAHDGDPDGAIESCRAILAVAQSIGDEPFLVSGFYRHAIWDSARRAITRVLAQGEVSDGALAALQNDILRTMNDPILARNLRWERASLDEIIRRIRDAEIPIEGLNGGWKPGGPVPTVTPWGKRAFDYSRALGLEWMNRAEDITGMPIPDRLFFWREWRADITDFKFSTFWSSPASLATTLIPEIEMAETASTRCRTEQATMFYLVAAERHRRRTGDWPELIGDIGRDLLPEAPLDPFSGEDYVITREDGRFLVHSVGTNGEDDGGEYDPRTWRQYGPDDINAIAWDAALRGLPPDEPEMPPAGNTAEMSDPDQTR